MTLVPTVTGEISGEALGFTLAHEHLRARSDRETVEVQFPHLFDVSAEISEAAAALRKARKLGVRTICDPTVMGLSRDVRFMRAVSEAAGAHVVAATGVYCLAMLPRYFANGSIEELASAFIHDLTKGIQGTSIRAGFLKCATDGAGVTADVEKSLRAVARASRATGAPIMTHTDATARVGLLQQDIFEEEGISLDTVMIGHCGDSTDLAYLERVARRGSVLGMDRYGMDDILPTPERNRVVAALVDRGYASSMILSHDSVTIAPPLTAPAGSSSRRNWHLTHIAEDVLPGLRHLGVSTAAINEMTIKTPRRWLEGHGKTLRDEDQPIMRAEGPTWSQR